MAAGEDPGHAAQQQWDTVFRYDKEDRQPEHLLVYGGELAFAQLVQELPRADEQLPDWPQDETHRFGLYARRLWDSVLARERLVDR